MCYHQARSARFIGHCWGRGWRDATENLLQTSIINRLGSFPVRRICGTEKSTTFFLFFCASRFRWGTVVHGGGVEEQKNKQTKHKQQVTTAVKQRLPRKLTGVIFLCSQNKSQPKKRPLPFMNKPTLLYKRSPREALIRESNDRCATLISSIINN